MIASARSRLASVRKVGAEMGDKTRGLYEKFRVERTDGKSAPGEKHDGCEYFVLDVTHDPYAADALRAYAHASAAEYPLLADDVRKMAEFTTPAAPLAPALPRSEREQRIAAQARAATWREAAELVRKGAPIAESPGPLFAGGARTAERCWAEQFDLLAAAQPPPAGCQVCADNGWPPCSPEAASPAPAMPTGAVPGHCFDIDGQGWHRDGETCSRCGCGVTAPAMPEHAMPERAEGGEGERETVYVDVRREVERARRKHAAMQSPHEGYAVILEELDELWDEIKKQRAGGPEMRKEALQVAAMALRFVEDLIDQPSFALPAVPDAKGGS